MANYAELRKTLHTSNKTVQQKELPLDSIPLGTLKILEEEFKKRGITHEGNSYPLWFHAETERNIYLWRCGYSLIQADEFEFWVDVDLLLEKRIKQLNLMSDDNPFLTPSWDGDSIASIHKESEKEYLLSLKEAFSKISEHAHALGQVVNLICEIEESDRETVLLPVKKK